MSTIRDKGFTLADPMDDLLDFDRTLNSILYPKAESDTDDLIVGSIANYTPLSWGYANMLYYNPYSEWVNVVLLPALFWASTMAIVGGPWETILYWIQNDFTLDSSLSNYVRMQIIAMFWGPIQVVYYILRGIGFIILIPYNIFVFFLNLLIIPFTLIIWFWYFLKACVWWLDVAFVISNAWNNDPASFVAGFFELFNYGLVSRILLFWFWIPYYYVYFVFIWFWGDLFETRPNEETLY